MLCEKEGVCCNSAESNLDVRLIYLITSRHSLTRWDQLSTVDCFTYTIGAGA